MKKFFITIAAAVAFIFALCTEDASAGSHPLNLSDSNFTQDTNPRPKHDTTKWNKKKYKDSTGRSRRDSI